MKRTFLPLLAALSLGACTANQALQRAPVIGPVCSAADATLIDEKALYTANAFYNVPAQAYVVANRAGRLSPALKGSLRPKLLTMHRLLRAMKAAKGSVNCDYKSMLQLRDEVNALLPKGHEHG